MDNILDEIPEDTELSDQDIFIRIWTEPRRVFKFINENHYDKYVTALLLLSGISKAFDRATMKNMGDHFSIWSIIGMCTIAGALFGWISYYIYAALLSWTGRWFNARGDTKSILRILAYGMTPSVLALVFLIPQITIYGNEIFKSDGDIISQGWISNILVYGSMVVEFVLGVCTIIFCVVGTSEVQKLSIWKSILNLLLPAIIILVPIFIIALLLV